MALMIGPALAAFTTEPGRHPAHDLAAAEKHQEPTDLSAALSIAARESPCSATVSANGGRLHLCEADLDGPVNTAALQKLSVSADKALNIHRALALSPDLFDGLAAMAAAIKQIHDLGPQDIELTILRTAQLKKGRYQLAQHRTIARRVGFSDAKLDALNVWRQSALYDSREKALLNFVEQSLQPTAIANKSYQKARQFFSEKQLVEIVLISGFAASSCQFTNAFSVPMEQ